MDRALRPGMRLMRALGVSGKFAVIAVLLVLPLVVSLGAAWSHASGDLRSADREREGLEYAAPLVRLSTQMWLSADADQAVVRPDSITGMDAVNRKLGERLNVSDQWIRLRRLLAPLSRPAARGGGRAPAGSRQDLLASATGSCRDLLESVVDAGQLQLDPQFDTHHLILALVTELPRLAQAAGDARHTEDSVDAIAGAARLGAARGDLLDHYTDVASSLVKVRQMQGDSGLERSPATLLTGLLTDLRGIVTQALSSPVWQATAATIPDAEDYPGPSSRRSPGVAQAPAVASRGSFSGLAEAADHVAVELNKVIDADLEQRHERLVRSRSWPVAVTLGILTCTGYLFLALFRSTSQDLHFVLGHIGRVAESGAVDSGDGLSGPDEFAQLSRAVVEARDTLSGAMGELSYLARHDELTSLGNRRFLLEKLEDRLSSAGPGQQPARGALALLDVLGLKDINDSFGDAMGDQILLSVTQRIHRATARRDVVARIGAEQFGLLLSVETEEAACEALGEIIRAVEQPITVGGRRLHVRMVSGVTLIDRGQSAQDLLRDAAIAKAVTHGPGRPHIEMFAPRLRLALRNRVELSADLVPALEQGELSLHYQPVIDLARHSLYGVEALVRWNHPTRGLLGPDTFIPLGEATGLIEPLGRWVLSQAAKQLASWSVSHPDARGIRMDVNVSPAQLAEDQLVIDLISVLEDTGLDPRRIVLEITETALMTNVETTARRLRELAALGVTIALDDFGTGHSSLAHLRRLPVEIVKIDKSFVSGSDHNGNNGAELLHGIIGLARSLGLQTIAEGVETAAQATQLRDFGCHLGQGYLFGRPVAATEMSRLLDLAVGGRWPVPSSRFPAPRDCAPVQPRTGAAPARPADLPTD